MSGRSIPAPSKDKPVNMRLIDWIWTIRGSLELAPGQSSHDAFERLSPLFQETGTTHERSSDTLTFRKKDQAAQDKMSVFDEGTVQVRHGAGNAMLHYRLTSRALLFCFLAPLLFLAFGGMTIGLGKLDKPAAEESKKKDDKKDAQLPQHWIDKALGAPVPEKPKKDKAKGAEDEKHSPTTAYVFAGIFAALYVAGRLLEDRLIRSLFRRRLFDAAPEGMPLPA